MPPQRGRTPSAIEVLTDEIIIEHIGSGSRVIDLGCGDGRLLERLRDDHRCSILGLEREMNAIVAAMGRGIPVIKADLDEGLGEIPDNAFDVAVLSQTLQQVRKPKDLVVEIMRIASRALIVVPNFGHWRVRLQVLAHGRAPVTDQLPYEWYNTPNLHFMSMRDFSALVDELGIRVANQRPIIHGHAVDRAWCANFRADSALFVLERNNVSKPRN